MDSRNSENTERQEDKLRVDILDRLEMYQVMAKCFYDRLSKEEKLDAMNEVVDILKGKTEK